MKLRGKMAIIGGFLFFLIFTATLSPPAPPLRAAPLLIKNSGTFIFETAFWPMTLDPASNWESNQSGIIELIYETLIDYEWNSGIDLEEELATSWAVSPDGLQYNFTLREGVIFHDNVSFNAYVMKYSLDRGVLMNDLEGAMWMIGQFIKGGFTYMNYWDQANVAEALEYLSAGGIVVIDDYHLTINLEYPYTPFLHIMAYPTIAAVSPKAIVENVPSDYVSDQSDDEYGMVSLLDWFPDLTVEQIRTKLGLSSGHDVNISGVVPYSPASDMNAHDWMEDHAVGTGSYQLIEFEEEKLIRYGKYTDWWGTFTENSPNEVLIKKIDNVSTRISDIKAGIADEVYIPIENASEIINVTKFTQTGELEVLPTVGGVQAFNVPNFNVRLLGMNMNYDIPITYLEEDPSSDYNSSAQPRYAWNQTGPEALLASPDNPFTALKFRKAFAMAFNYETYINSVLNGFGEQLEGIIPNGMLGHHEQLIENGFIPTYDPDAAEALFQEIGWNGTIKLVYIAGNHIYEQTCLLLKDAIEAMDVGINISVAAISMSEYRMALIFNELPIIFISWVPEYADPDDYIVPFLHSEFGYYSNLINYNNPTLDDMIGDASIEQNSSIRENLYWNIEETAAKDYPFIYGHQEHRFIVIRDWIQNYEESGSFNPMSFMLNAESINKVDVETTPTTTTTTEPTTTITATTPTITTEPTTTITTTTPNTTTEPTTTITTTISTTTTTSEEETSLTTKDTNTTMSSSSLPTIKSIPAWSVLLIIFTLLVIKLGWKRKPK